MTIVPPSPEPTPPSPGRSVENTIERVLYGGRWLLLPLYLGLTVILVLFTLKFIQEVIHVAPLLLQTTETDLILTALTLVDLVLVASLIVMVMISGYENFVSRIELPVNEDRLIWLGKLEYGTLKVKVATSIVAISSIHLLKAFMNSAQTSNDKLMWLVIIHMTFVVSAFMMGVLDRFVLVKHD